ncbi:MAG: putative glycoside hydrolase [Gemmatimonadota bacterium]
MNPIERREFLRVAGASAAASVLLPKLAFGESEPFSAWTWVHGGGATDLAGWRAQYQRFRDAGLTGVLVGGGDTAIHAEAAHAAGLALHRWTWALNRSGDAKVKAEHPEWFSVSRKGESSLTHPPYVGYYQWLCPTREPVREYLRGVVDEVAAAPGVDAVHLDYIRHPDVILPRNLWEKYGLVQDHEMPEYDFCYCEVCRATFRQQHGKDPLRLKDPASNRDWVQFRYDSVTQLVTGLARTVHARGKAISAAVFPTPTIARKEVRQAWDRWPLDLVFPMLYHSFHRETIEWIGRGAAEGVAALPRSVPLVAGVHLPDLPPADLQRAVQVARDGGASGISMYDSGGLTDAHLAALSEVLR